MPDDPGCPLGVHQERHGKVIRRSHRTSYVTGTDHADPDAGAVQVAAQGLAPNADRRLARTVGGCPREATKGSERGHDGNLTVAAGPHPFHSRHHRIDHTGHVGIEDVSRLGLALAPAASPSGNAGIGDHEVEWLGHVHLGDPIGKQGGIPDVDRCDPHFSTRGAASLGDRLEARCVAAAQSQGYARGSVGPRQGGADSTGAAGDQNGAGLANFRGHSRLARQVVPAPMGCRCPRVHHGCIVGHGCGARLQVVQGWSKRLLSKLKRRARETLPWPRPIRASAA